MKIAYLVTAYNNPAHLHRLLQAIVTPSSAAYVHVDAKFDIEPFERNQFHGVHFVKPRVAVYWGEFTMVEAILRLIASALGSQEQYDYLILISGTDYPIRPIPELEAFLGKNAGTQFISLVKMPDEEVSKPLTRLRHYKVLSGNPFAIPLKLARRALIQSGVLPAQRSFEAALKERQPYAGSTWWALTRDACRYVLDFVERETAFVRFYRNTWFPDEGMIHTIIGNSPFAPRTRRNLTYTDWSARGAHPEMINAEHVRRFIEEPALIADDRYGPGEVFFARKFSDASAPLIERLNAFIGCNARGSRRTRVTTDVDV
jgi:hypothetical protein